MNKLIKIYFLGLMVIFFTTGCAMTDPYHRPQPATQLGSADMVSVPGPESGMDVLESYRIGADKIPTNHQMMVTWDLTIYPSRRSQRTEQRRNCEVLIKPAGALNFNIHTCEEVRRIGPDRLVVFNYHGNRMAINLSSQPGGYVQNGFCERLLISPAQTVTVPVVWSTTATIRTGDPIRIAVGCR